MKEKFCYKPKFCIGESCITYPWEECPNGRLSEEKLIPSKEKLCYEAGWISPTECIANTSRASECKCAEEREVWETCEYGKQEQDIIDTQLTRHHYPNICVLKEVIRQLQKAIDRRNRRIEKLETKLSFVETNLEIAQKIIKRNQSEQPLVRGTIWTPQPLNFKTESNVPKVSDQKRMSYAEAAQYIKSE